MFIVQLSIIANCTPYPMFDIISVKDKHKRHVIDGVKMAVGC